MKYIMSVEKQDEIECESEEQAIQEFLKDIQKWIQITAIKTINGKEVRPLENIQVSPSRTATCWYCNEKIGMKNPRGIILINTFRNYLSRYFVCYKCLKEYDLTDEQKKYLQELVDKHKSDMIITQIEQQDG